MRKGFAGGATPATLEAGIDGDDSTFNLSLASGWPSTAVGPVVAVIDPESATEEKVLIGTRIGTACTDVTRGYDGTSAQPHSAGAVVWHVIDAITIDEANAFANLPTTPGDLIIMGPSVPQRLAASATDGMPLVSTPGAPVKAGWSPLKTAGLTDAAVTTPKVATEAITEPKLADGAVSLRAMDIDSVGAAQIVDDAVGPPALADDAVTQPALADASVGTAQLIDANVTVGKLAGGITQAKLASASVGTAQLIDANVTLVKLAQAVAVGLHGAGLAAAKPAHIASVYQFYLETDTGFFRVSNGTAWAYMPGQILARAIVGSNLVATGVHTAGADLTWTMPTLLPGQKVRLSARVNVIHGGSGASGGVLHDLIAVQMTNAANTVWRAIQVVAHGVFAPTYNDSGHITHDITNSDLAAGATGTLRLRIGAGNGETAVDTDTELLVEVV